jgi:hypothetical protein
MREDLTETCLRIRPTLLSPPSAFAQARRPWFALTLTRVRWSDEEQTITVADAGGTLVFDVPPRNAKKLGNLHPIVFHSGCAVPPYYYRIGPRGTFKDTGRRWQYQIPNVDPGMYSLCSIRHEELVSYAGSPPAFESCVSGTLAPGGVFELSLLP